MIPLVVALFVIFPSDALRILDRVHSSDSLRIKCDSLLYRSAYFDTRCYFAVFREIVLDDVEKECASIFPGAKISPIAPAPVYDVMRIDAHSKTSMQNILLPRVFQKTNSTMRLLCVVEQQYRCAKGEQSKLIPGMCTAHFEKDVNFADAEAHCAGLDMQLPAIGNDLENRVIRGARVKWDAWIRNLYVDRKWSRDKLFGRYSTCARQMFIGYEKDIMQKSIMAAEHSPRICAAELSAVIDKFGYWHYVDRTHLQMAFICVAEARNDFTSQESPVVLPIGVKPTHGAPCAKYHTPDRAGECRWAGPKDACAQLVDFYGRTWFTPMPKFPRETFVEIRIDQPPLPVNDATVKVIVRRGCMFFGYMHPKGAPGSYSNDNYLELLISVNHSTYGEHKVPCKLTGELKEYTDGLSRVNCFCDPTEATLNDHVPAPPPGNQCVEHHVFNEATKACEWKFESKYCGELITHDGRRQMLEIPNWPTNRRYDVDHYKDVTEIIVRQHCWATLYWTGYNPFVASNVTLATSGYGKHQVASKFNGLLANEEDGTHRIVCECIR